MVSRRNFLKGLAAAPVVLAVDPGGAISIIEDTKVVQFAGKMPKPFPVPTPLSAHGGWCVPLSPTYELVNISAVNRPILDSLPPIRIKAETT